MKTIKWIGGFAAAATTALVIALTSSASAGDVIVVKSTGPVALTAGQLSALQSWVVSEWPGAPESDIDTMTCQHMGTDDSDDVIVICSAYRTSTISALEYSTREVNRTAIGEPEPEDIAADGSTVKTKIRIGKKRISQSGMSTLASGSATVFGIPAARLRSVSFNVADGVFMGHASYFDPLNPVQRLLCRRAKTCGKVVGAVE